MHGTSECGEDPAATQLNMLGRTWATFPRLRVGAAVLLERAVSTISREYQWITGGSVAQAKRQKSLCFTYLRRLEYASSNQGVGGSNPSGRTKNIFMINELTFRRPQKSTKNRASGK